MKTAPFKTGMTVNGKRMDLEHFLLDVAVKPLPKEPTHYIVAEVLNTDLSIKRISIYFNPLDTWKGANNWHPNTPQSVGMGIGEHLRFLDVDPNTLAYKFWVIEVASNMVVHGPVGMYSCTKCQL